MKVVSAKYNDLDKKTVLVTLDNDDVGIVTLDGINRRFTAYYEKFIKNGGEVEAFETDEEGVARVSKELQANLAQVYAQKKQECLDFISEVSYTKEIDDEYQTKLKLAQEALASNDFTAFTIDAKALSVLKGSTITPKQYAQLIASKGTAMIPTKDTAVLRMGTVRTVIGGLIKAGALDKAKEILGKVEKVDAQTIVTASEAQILGLLS